MAVKKSDAAVRRQHGVDWPTWEYELHRGLQAIVERIVREWRARQ